MWHTGRANSKRFAERYPLNYFAYGSNMSLARLRARVSSARPVGTYQLMQHELRFHKSGADGSGKCDAFHTGENGHRVLGVLYQIDPAHKAALDRIEGLGHGYAEKEVALYGPEGQLARACTYYALRIDASLPAYSWYREHVLTGAREARLPATYINGILGQHTVADPDHHRERRELGIYRPGK